MQRLLFWLLLSAAAAPVYGQNPEWLNDVQQARDRAAQENKFVLLNFTGSDWCRACMQLKGEVFDTPEFAAFAQSKLILVEVDFPSNKGMALLHKEANKRLARTYRIGSYPTLIVLNSAGVELTRFGYVFGGPDAFIAKLERETHISEALAPPPEEPELPKPPRKEVTWTPPPPPVQISYGPLALKAISGPKDRRIVLINNASLMIGEKAKVRAQEKEVVVVCKEIRDDSVLIICDGKPMELKLKKPEQ